jgi:hypothetical protein
VGTGGPARSATLFQVEEHPDRWLVRQVLDDPDAGHDWAIRFEVDLAASDAEGAPVVHTLAVERL